MVQINYMYNDNDQGRVNQIVNFMTGGVGILVLGRGHFNHDK